MSYIYLLFLWCLLILGIVNADNAEAKKMQEEYLKSNLTIPDEPLDAPNAQHTEAYCYLLCSRPEFDPENNYYNALRLIAYRQKFISRHYDLKPKDLIIMACSFTPQWQIDKLKELDVIIIVVDTIIAPGNISNTPRYIDVMTKLQVYRLTNWERVLFLDIDTTVTNEIVKIWDEPAGQIRTVPPDPKYAEYYPYLFAACEDRAQRLQGLNDTYFNTGVFMFMPDMKYFKRVIEEMKIYNGTGRYPEQDFLSYYYNQSSPHPSTRFPTKYNRFIWNLDDVKPDGIIFHAKLWDYDQPHLKPYINNWWNDYHHIFQNKPLSLDRIYNYNDDFFIKNRNNQAYIFVLQTKPEHKKEFSNTFQRLNQTITQIKEVEKDTNRDIIVFTTEETPSQQLNELQQLGTLVLRIKNLKLEQYDSPMSSDFIKLMFWKLANWERILFIDHNIGIDITSKDFLSIWDDEGARIINNPQQSYDPSFFTLPDLPAQNIDYYYPYLFSTFQKPAEDKFNTDMFMFKPSIRHFQYLMALLKKNSHPGMEELLNVAYSKDGPLPFSEIKKVDNGYKLNEKKVFHEFILDSDLKKTFAEKESDKQKCGLVHNLIKVSYVECPIKADSGSSECQSLSNECIDCLYDENCTSCKGNMASNNNTYKCTVNKQITNKIIGYCSEDEGDMVYITMNLTCELKPAIGILILTCMLGIVVFLIIYIIRNRRKLRYAQMVESSPYPKRNIKGADTSDRDEETA